MDSFAGIPADVEYVSVDLETTGLNKTVRDIVGLAFSYRAQEAFYIPVRHKDWPNVQEQAMVEFCKKHFSGKTCVFFNAGFDIGFLRKVGFSPDKFLDVKALFYNVMIHETRRIPRLKDQAKAIFQCQMLELYEVLGITERQLKSNSKNFGDIPVDKFTLAYCCADADMTLRLFEFYRDKKDALGDKFKRIRELDHQLVDVAMRLQDRGICIDITYLADMKKKAEKELAECYYKFQVIAKQRLEPIYEKATIKLNEDFVAMGNEAALKDAKMKKRAALLKRMKKMIDSGLNMNSPKQLMEYFYRVLQLEVQFNVKTKRPSTDEDALHKLYEIYGEQYAEFKILRRYREIDKILNTYIEAVMGGLSPVDNRLHPSLHTASLITGRLSMGGDGEFLKKLNSQALPKVDEDDTYNIRRSFIPTPGFTWVAIDLANIELRIIAQYSKEPKMIEAFLANKNLHKMTCVEILHKDPEIEDKKFYKVAKTMNYNMAYTFGITALRNKLWSEVDLKFTPEECWDFFNAFFEGYPVWKKYKQVECNNAQKTKYVTTVFGRTRSLAQDYTSAMALGRWALAHVDHTVLNYPIQGSCADLNRFSMARTHNFIMENKQLLDDVWLLLSIHDELCFEVKGKPGEERFDLIVEKLTDIMSWTPPGWTVPVVAEPSVGASFGQLRPWVKGVPLEKLEKKK